MANPDQVPNIGSARVLTRRRLRLSDEASYIPGGKTIDGSKARDPLNTGYLHTLRPGMVMGKIASGGKYAPAIIGLLTAAYDASADTTEMTVSAATAVEMVRRIGTSGTFKVTGPPAASGTVQTITVTYSAIDTSTGVITITALTIDVDEVVTITPTVEANADCVQTITTGGTQTAGTFKLGIKELGDPESGVRWTDTIAWSATEATQTASVQTALDNLLGANVIVAGTIADTDTMVLVLTWSGTGATNKVQGLCSIDVSALTGASTATVAMTTDGAGTISAGNYRIGVVDDSDDVVWTDTIAFDANAAAINAALDAAFTPTGIVATGGPMSGPTAVVLTFSGAGYAAIDQPTVQVDISNLVGAGSMGIAETTTGVTVTDKDFVIGSFVQPTDGSETPKTLIDDNDELKMTDDDEANISSIAYARPLVGGQIDSSQIINWPSDASLVTWLKQQLNSDSNEGFFFDDTF